MIAGPNFRFEIFKICSWLICKFSSASEQRKDDCAGRAPVKRSCPGRRVGEPAVFWAGSPDGGRRSGVLQPNGIVNRLPKPLLAPEIALPRRLAPFTRRMPAASSGLSSPVSAASYTSRRTEAKRTLIVDGARLFCSRKNRYRSTTVRLKASHGSEQYQPMNSSIAWP